MSTHTYRDSSMLLKSREFIRQCLPEGRLGFSIEDVDVSLRLFRQNDPVGTWRLIENKVGTDYIGTSKEFHFALWDVLWRRGDPGMRFYKGYFVVNTPTDDWCNCDQFRVNGVELTAGQFKRWLWADSLEDWARQRGSISDESKLEAVRLACEAAIYELVDIKPYQFRTWIVSKITAACKEAEHGR